MEMTVVQNILTILTLILDAVSIGYVLQRIFRFPGSKKLLRRFKRNTKRIKKRMLWLAVGIVCLNLYILFR